MCLGVPGLVIERQASVGELESALVEFAGVRRSVCVACVPDVEPGEYVIVHAGFAISKVDQEEAARILAWLSESGEEDGWAAAANGEPPP
jgi:hydrogenase expression/formation protein HypC